MLRMLEFRGASERERVRETKRKSENRKQKSLFYIEKEKKESNVLYSHLEVSCHMIQVFKII